MLLIDRVVILLFVKYENVRYLIVFGVLVMIFFIVLEEFLVMFFVGFFLLSVYFINVVCVLEELGWFISVIFWFLLLSFF